MELVTIAILVVAIPVILFPAAFVWYINIGGLWAAYKQYRHEKAIKKTRARILAKT